jgi:hypothetical protein
MNPIFRKSFLFLVERRQPKHVSLFSSKQVSCSTKGLEGRTRETLKLTVSLVHLTQAGNPEIDIKNMMSQRREPGTQCFLMARMLVYLCRLWYLHLPRLY